MICKNRPRVDDEVQEMLEDLKENLKKDVKDYDSRTVFESAQGKVTYNLIIKIALQKIKNEINKGEITYTR